VFTKADASVVEATFGIGSWVRSDNNEGKHQALRYQPRPSFTKQRCSVDMFITYGLCTHPDRAHNSPKRIRFLKEK
jgi:hypothetical protein